MLIIILDKDKIKTFITLNKFKSRFAKYSAIIYKQNCIKLILYFIKEYFNNF